jgi:hypothetical protein
VPTSRGTRLAIREARLITAELRRLGLQPRTIAKIWAVVIGVPVLLVLGYLVFNYNPGTEDPSILRGIQIIYKDNYTAHVKNNTSLILKTLTLKCSPEGDGQPSTSTTSLHPQLEPGYGEDVYINSNCRLIRVNQSHQLW